MHHPDDTLHGSLLLSGCGDGCWLTGAWLLSLLSHVVLAGVGGRRDSDLFNFCTLPARTNDVAGGGCELASVLLAGHRRVFH